MITSVVISVLAAFVAATFVFFWRLSITVYENLRTFFSIGIRFRWTIGICFGIYLLGLAPIHYQNEVMSGMDIVWECGLFDAGTVVDSFLLFPTAWMWQFISPQINDIALIVRNFFVTEFRDLVTAFEISQSPTVREAISEAYDYYHVTVIRAAVSGKSNYVTLPSITSVVAQIMTLIMIGVQIITETIIELTTFQIITQDIFFCRYQNTLSIECQFMTFSPQHNTPNCMNAHDVAFDIFLWLNKIMDLVTLNQFTTYWMGLPQPEADATAATFKRPIFLFLGLLDRFFPGVITGCINDGNVGQYIESWISDIVTSYDALLTAITNGQITDFFGFIFGALFSFVSAVIDIFKAMIACITSHVPCVGSGYDCTRTILACIRDDPKTANSFGYLAGFLYTLLGDFQFAIDTVEKPFVALVACLDDFNPNSPTNPCTPPGNQVFFCVVQQLVCIQHDPDTANNFGVLAGPLASAFSAIDTAIGNVDGTIQCIGGECAGELSCFDLLAARYPPCNSGGCSVLDYFGCLFDCFTSHDACCAKTDSCKNIQGYVCPGGSVCFHKKRNLDERDEPSQGEPFQELKDLNDHAMNPANNYTIDRVFQESWHIVLTKKGIMSTSTCGKLLYETHPMKATDAAKTPWGQYTMYMMCLRMNIPEIPFHMSQKRAEPRPSARVITLKTILGDSVVNKTYLYEQTKWVKDTSDVYLKWFWGKLVESKYYSAAKNMVIDSYEVYEKYGIEDGQHLNLLMDNAFAENAMSNAWNDKHQISATNNFMSTQLALKDYQNQVTSYKTLRAYRELSEIYVTFVNEVLFHFKSSFNLTHTNMTVSRMWNTSENSHALIKDTNYVYTNVNLTKPYNFVNAVYSIFNKRYGFSYWKSYRTIHMLNEAYSGKVNISQFRSWISGESEYIADRGFVPKEDYEKFMTDKKIYTSSPMMSLLVNNTFGLRHPSWKTGIFLLPDMGYESPSPIDVTNFLTKHFRERIQREDVIYKVNITDPQVKTSMAQVLRQRQVPVAKIMRGRKVNSAVNPYSFNFNELMLQLFDALATFIVREAVATKEAIDALIDKIRTADYQGFFNHDVKNFFVRWTTCTIPDNFNGTTIYNPFCFPLVPEDTFNWVSLTPNVFWPVQIAWPVQLILKNCTNNFTGDSQPLSFRLSNNCGANDGNTRPFCSICDYCPRTYDQCKDFGFQDFFDSIMYVLGTMPWYINHIFTAGVPLQVALNYIIGFISMITIITTIPTLFTPFFPVMIIIMFLRIFLPLEIQYLWFWTFSMWFEDITFATIVTGFIVGAIIGAAVMGILWNVVQRAPLLLLVISSYILVYIVSIFYQFPVAHFNPTNWLAGAVRNLNLFLMPLFVPDFSWLADRISRFDYSEGPPDGLDQLCFVWTFSNIGFAPIAVLLIAFVVSLGLRVAYVVLLYLFDLVSLTSSTRRDALIGNMQMRFTLIGSKIKIIKDRIKDASVQIRKAVALAQAYRRGEVNENNFQQQDLPQIPDWVPERFLRQPIPVEHPINMFEQEDPRQWEMVVQPEYRQVIPDEWIGQPIIAHPNGLMMPMGYAAQPARRRVIQREENERRIL